MAYWLTVGFNTTKIMIETVFPPGLKSAATTDETEGSSFMEHHWPTKPALMMVYLWRNMPTQLDKCHTLAKHHHVLNVSLGLKWPSFRVKQQIRDFRQGLSFIDILLANPLFDGKNSLFDRRFSFKPIDFFTFFSHYKSPSNFTIIHDNPME